MRRQKDKTTSPTVVTALKDSVFSSLRVSHDSVKTSMKKCGKDTINKCMKMAFAEDPYVR